MVEGLPEEEDLWDEEKNRPIENESPKMDRKALRIIENTIDEELQNEVGEAETAVQAFSKIWYRFSSKRKDEGWRAKREIYSIKKGNLTIEELIKTLRELSSTVKVCLEENIKEEEKIAILLMALPEE